MSTSDRQAHWQTVYKTKAESEVSWYEDTPELSMVLLRQAGLTPDMSVIDIGGGASRLVDALVASGQAHISVLDPVCRSHRDGEVATDRCDACAVDRIGHDRLDARRQYDLWHDRAAFHFLTEAADQKAYVRVLGQALKNGGKAVIGTFAPDGPEKCSGLPVARYDAQGLQDVLGSGFKLAATRRHEHTTPSGSVQQFQFSTFEKVAGTESFA